MILLVADRWTEGAALDGAEGVEIAGAGGGVEDGAGLVVGEVGEGVFMVEIGKEETCGWVAGKVGEKACVRIGDTRADALREGWLGEREAFAELVGVQLRDREDTDAALVTARFAGEPFAGPLGSGR